MQTINSVNVLELSKYTLDPLTIIRGNDNFGKIFKINDFQYSGELDENDLPHGQGTIEYIGHSKIKSYFGNFCHGEKNGTGTEIYNNDNVYHGEFMNGLKNGSGKLYNTNGLLKYGGMWLNDSIEIIGYEYKNNKKIYYGCIKDNNYHGYGIEYQDDRIIRIGHYENGRVIKAINFHKNNQITIIKEIQTEHENIVKTMIDDLYSRLNITIDEIKAFDKYMLFGKVENVTQRNMMNIISYVGSIEINLDDGTVKRLVGKYYANNNNKHVLEGEFETQCINNMNIECFVFGTIITTKKSNHHIPIATGKFKEFDINYHSIDYDYIGKRLELGKLYNMNHRIFKYWTNTNKVYFDGTFANGRPVSGKLYKYNNYNNNNIDDELLYDGIFESNTELSIGIFSKFKEGQLYIENKLNYEGQLSNGDKHGKGCSFYQDGTIEYIGSFSNGHKHGQGMLFDSIGNLIAEGQFNQDEIQE